MADLLVKAVVTREDGSKFYRQEQEWFDRTDEDAAAMHAAIDKHDQYLHQLERDQKKDPEEIFTATLSRTGHKDMVFEGIAYDSFEKAARAWNKLGDELIRLGGKRVKG